MDMRNLAAKLATRIVFSLALTLSGYAPQALAKPAHYYVKAACAAKSNCFASIQSALDSAAQDTSDQWVVVDVAAGSYYEKLTISRGKVQLRGQGKDRTRVYFDAVAQTAGKYHRDKWGTPGSATLTINADQVKVEGLTVENTYDFLSNDALPDGDPKKISNSQGVALLLDKQSDRVSFNKTALIGYQDTLFANGKRVLLRNSHISGNIDFIFGNGQILIEDSVVQSRRRSATFAPGEFQSFIVAPSTQLTQPLGIVIYRSRLTREDGVPDNSVALGRPWHPTTTFADGRYADPNAVGQASFIDCYMDAHIHSDHWTSMNGTARDGTKSAVFKAQDSRFSEAGSSGPGARRSDIGMKWTEAMDIKKVHKLFFEGWPEAAK
jgi:pectinesterase